MWAKWARQGILIVALGGLMLAMSVSLGMAQPALPTQSVGAGQTGATFPQKDDPIGAQGAPSASITAPSSAIGDFGANHGNVWDMNSTSDIVWRQEGFPVEERPEEGTVVRGHIPEGSALGIAFYASSTTNLPSSQYHQLTYRLKIAAEGNCMTNGRIIYAKNWPYWLGSQVISHGFLPHEAPMYCPNGTYCIYYMDLSRNDNDIVGPDTATWFQDPPPWPTDPVKAFGIWPHEWWVNCSGGPSYFDLDYVYLTGDIVTKEKEGYKYTLKWNVSDPDGGSIVSTIRYMEVDELQLPSNSPSCNAASFGDSPSTPPSYPNKVYLPLIVASQTRPSGEWKDFSPVATKTTGTGSQTYQLDFSDDSRFTDGKSYYLCVRVNDGTSSTYWASSAPVIRVPYSPNYGDE
jgi:hypothetical protein